MYGLAVGADARPGQALILPHPDGSARAGGVRGQRAPGFRQPAEAILRVGVRIFGADDGAGGVRRELIQGGWRTIVRRQDIHLRREKLLDALRHQQRARGIRPMHQAHDCEMQRREGILVADIPNDYRRMIAVASDGLLRAQQAG